MEAHSGLGRPRHIRFGYLGDVRYVVGDGIQEHYFQHELLEAARLRKHYHRTQWFPLQHGVLAEDGRHSLRSRGLVLVHTFLG